MSTIGNVKSSTDLSRVNTAPNSADGVIGQIQGAAAQLTALSGDLMSLIAELQAASNDIRDHLAAKPTGAAATPAAMTAWQSKMDALQAKLPGIGARIEAKKKEIDAKEAELVDLQNTKLPQAKENDRAALEAQIKQAREIADTARDAAAPRSSGADSLAAEDPSAVEKRKLVFGQTAAVPRGIPVE